MKNDNVFDPFDKTIRSHLNSLNQNPTRNAIHQAKGRAKFLSEAYKFQRSISYQSNIQKNGWITTVNFWLRKTSRNRAFVTILFALIFIFGGFTTLFATAQSALPGQVLYHVKLLSEAYRLQITTRIQDRFDLSLLYSDRRIWEAKNLAQKGYLPSEDLLDQYQTQIQTTIFLSAGLPEDDISDALVYLQNALHDQEKTLLQLSGQVGNAPLIQQWVSLIQNQIDVVAEGIKAPMVFRGRFCNWNDPNLILMKQYASSQNGIDSTDRRDCYTPSPGLNTQTASISITTLSSDEQVKTKPSFLPLATPTQLAPRQPVTVTAQEIISTPVNQMELITQTTPG